MTPPSPLRGASLFSDRRAADTDAVTTASAFLRVAHRHVLVVVPLRRPAPAPSFELSPFNELVFGLLVLLFLMLPAFDRSVRGFTTPAGREDLDCF